MKHIYLDCCFATAFVFVALFLSSNAEPIVKEKYILISVHDATPFYEKDLNIFLSELDKRNVTNFTILVVPNFEESYDITQYPEFTANLKKYQSNGAELIIHGYNHSKDEFMYANTTDAEAKIHASLNIFNKSFDAASAGFIFPLWRGSQNSITVLKAKGFQYTETFSKIIYFSGKEYSGFPIGMESYSDNEHINQDKLSPFISKTFSEAYAEFIWNHNGVVRYTIHPREAENGNFNATLDLLDGFLKRGWQPGTYSQLENLEK